MTSDCKKVWVITDDIYSDVRELSWSPDGKWIVYELYNYNTKKYELWKVSVFE
jgi:Tol biopolymer transport system component